MKKKLCIFISFIFMLTNIVNFASAKTNKNEYYPHKIIIFGDSISTGYGLEGYDHDSPQHGYNEKNYIVMNYGKILKEKYSLSDYYNLASDGLTSSELLEMLKTGDYDEKLKSSDYIIISIGGNDVLQFFYKALGEATGLGDDYTFNDIKNINLKDKAVYKNIISYLTSDELSKSKESTNKNFKDSFLATKDYIIKQNPKAKIVFQTVFNPLSNATNIEFIDKAVESLLSDINKTIRENNIGSLDGKSEQVYYYVDIYSAFNKDAANYTNISKYDIHPNAKGHILISQLLDEKIKEIYYLSIQQADKETISNTSDLDSRVDVADNTVEKTSKNYTLYIITGSCVVVVAVLAYMISRRKQNGR